MTPQPRGRPQITDEIIKNCDLVRKDAQKKALDVASRPSREAWVTDKMLKYYDFVRKNCGERSEK
ncbi:MAG: hypothetical protein K5930_04105 [Treponemataceae bacterium]|nr:hypothetical protein [Treponemataceae bacterium]